MDPSEPFLHPCSEVHRNGSNRVGFRKVNRTSPIDANGIEKENQGGRDPHPGFDRERDVDPVPFPSFDPKRKAFLFVRRILDPRDTGMERDRTCGGFRRCRRLKSGILCGICDWVDDRSTGGEIESRRPDADVGRQSELVLGYPATILSSASLLRSEDQGSSF